MITIQRPTQDDVPGVQKVFYETWLATYPNEEAGITVEDIEEKFKGKVSPEVVQKRTESILNPTKNQLFLVAKNEDEVMGFCRIEKKETYNELVAIYVLPIYQHRGVGMMFWEKVNEFFDQEKDIIVHVATYNTQAIGFYQKLGFVDMGKRFKDEKHKMPVSGNIIPETELIIKYLK